jgi:hypothetical protein
MALAAELASNSGKAATTDGLTRERSVRLEQNPNKVRSLDPGMAYLISHGRAMKIQVPRAPALRTSLPQLGDPAEQNALQNVPFAGTPSKKGLDLPF